MANIDKIRNRIRNHFEEQKKQREARSNRYQAKWQKYYQSTEWKDLRTWKITTNPICENCQKYNIITSADEVHHLVPFGTGKDEQTKWKLLLDHTNLISLCKECHLEFHTKLKNNEQVTTVIPPKLKFEQFK